MCPAHLKSVPIRHSLPDFRTVSMFGSSEDGNCSSVITYYNNSPHHRIFRGSICNGTSVLNDGIIPALGKVSDNSSSLWATQLLIMRQEGKLPIILSFEVENQLYDCIELAVFNCPGRHMNASRINIYSDTSFRPERENASLGISIKANHLLSNTSCDYLLKFYVGITPEVTSSYFNLEFPGLTSENYVLVGEVSFLNGADDCEQRSSELIKISKSECMLNLKY